MDSITSSRADMRVGKTGNIVVPRDSTKFDEAMIALQSSCSNMDSIVRLMLWAYVAASRLLA
jgi:hypothetical protein